MFVENVQKFNLLIRAFVIEQFGGDLEPNISETIFYCLDCILH